MTTSNDIRDFVATLLRHKGDDKPFTDAESLVLSGRLDSLDVMSIVAHLESAYAIDFGDRPFNHQLVDSVEEIKELVATK
jgi:acyl carrier protein